MFSIRSVQSGYNEENLGNPVSWELVVQLWRKDLQDLLLWKEDIMRAVVYSETVEIRYKNTTNEVKSIHKLIPRL
jgi:hypothetical protein